ncbi:MAG: phage tail tape measure protein [Flavobacteriales bacterium]
MMRADEWRLKITENVNSAITRLTSGADKAAARFTRTQDRINQAVGNSAQTIRTGIGTAWKGATASVGEYSRGMLNSLPLPSSMSSALGGLAGPLGIAVGLTAALGVGLVKGVQAAEQFDAGFRELRNLNIDKSKGEIDALKTSLLDLSEAKGLDPQKVTAAYYDIQSATGQTGQSVLDLVGRVGEASRALNMDMGESVRSVAKSLVAFHLTAKDTDAVLTSNWKTVQTGIVTFDQLAKSQTAFTGAAAGANQTMDTANKVFAVFTQHTKSADIAAEMAKTAFMDLGKASTVAGLKKIGVSVFDANGGMRQTDDILRDLVPKMATMSDVTFSRLKEEIGGSEGLRGLLDAAKGSGAETLRVLNSFDSSKADLTKGIREGNKDLDTMKDILSNKLQVELIRLGEMAMPFVTVMVSGLIDMVHYIGDFVGWLKEGYHWFKDIYDSSTLVRGVIQGLFVVVKTGWTVLKTVIMTVVDAIVTPIKAIGAALKGDFKGAWDILKVGSDKTFNRWKQGASDVQDAMKSGAEETLGRKIFPVEVQPIAGVLKATAPAIPGQPKAAPAPGAPAKVGAPPVPGVAREAAPKVGAPPVPGVARLDASHQVGAPPVPGTRQPGAAPKVGAPAVPGQPPADPYAKLFKEKSEGESGNGGRVSKGVSDVVGGGKEVRNVNITIQSLVKELTVRVANVRDGGSEIKKVVEEALVRAVQGGELLIAND